MNYRIDKDGLFDRIGAWDGFLKKKVRLIACGGTALTILGVKPSTKDVDLLVPVQGEYQYLVGVLKQLGYKQASGYGWERGDGFIFDLFAGKRVHTTELLGDPLEKENHTIVKEFSMVYLGVLNYYDIIISKLFRGTSVDVEDCLMLVKARKNEIDLKCLEERFKETASFDVSEEKVNGNLRYFFKAMEREGSGR